MSRPDELGLRRARSSSVAATGPPAVSLDPAHPLTPDDLIALQRNRDAAAEALCAAHEELRRARTTAEDGAGQGSARQGVLLARERVQAAFDRLEAASLRLEAAHTVMQAHRDGLTGCLSRDSGLERLRQELDRSLREQSDLVVAFLDVDGLKDVNDTRGHLAGDAVLRAMGAALRECLRSYDVVLRFGGDEFVCGLPGAQLPEAKARLRDVATALDRMSAGARFTSGLALAYGPDDVESLLERADADLYRQRRNRDAVVRDHPLAPRSGA